jgi:uncharacterized protein YndB with AHSA1/START domain
MKCISDSIEIKASPHDVFSLLILIFSSEKGYKAWHKDHVTCSWTKGDPLSEGSQLVAEEHLHGKRHRISFVIGKLEKDKKLSFTTKFPYSLICPKGEFELEEASEGCIFTAKQFFRFGNILEVLFKKELDSLKEHMKEEGVNLKSLIEHD